MNFAEQEFSLKVHEKYQENLPLKRIVLEKNTKEKSMTPHSEYRKYALLSLIKLRNGLQSEILKEKNCNYSLVKKKQF